MAESDDSTDEWGEPRVAAPRSLLPLARFAAEHQKRGAQPMKWNVKPKTRMNKVKFSAVQVTAAVVKGEIRMWKYVDETWRGDAAFAMYQDLGKVLKKGLSEPPWPLCCARR